MNDPVHDTPHSGFLKTHGRWLLFGAVISALLIGLAVWRYQYPGRALDSVAWQDDARTGDGRRLRMADRLVARKSLQGRTRAEVVALLGEPPPTNHFSQGNLVYWLGPERGFISVDSEWLLIRLGDNGRVVDSRIVRD